MDEEEKAEQDAKPKNLKQTMIFAILLISRNLSEVEHAVKEFILYVERVLKHKVDRVHSDPGTEVSTKKSKNGVLPCEFEGQSPPLKIAVRTAAQKLLSAL